MAGLPRKLVLLSTLGLAFAQTPAPGDLVLHFDVNLVQVDAIVTDSRGNHVPGLQPDNFEVLQDGKKQKITHFSYIPSGDPATANAAPPVPVSDPRLPTPAPTRAEVRRTIVFMLDDSHMAFADFHYALQALQRYVDSQMQPNDMAAVVRTSYGSGSEQIFTSDVHWLHQMLQRVRWRFPVPSYIRKLAPTPPVLTELDAAIRALAQYPGRKSIVLISPGIQEMDPAWTNARQLADAANRASITIETIDCRGLPTLEAGLAAEHTRAPATGFIMNAQTNYFHSQDGLAFLAEMTAGRFQHDNNDLDELVRNAAADLNGYYLIGWYPGADAFERKPNRPLDYHRVQIHLRNVPGLSVRTRYGFFADPGNNVHVDYTPAQRMNDALFSPFRSGAIDVRLTASLGYDAHDDAYIESLLHILPAGVVFRQTPGQPECKSADLEILSTPEPLDSAGAPAGIIDGSHTSITVCPGPGGYLDEMLQSGIVVSVRNAVWIPGSYRMLVAVRNMAPGDQPSIGPNGLMRRSGTEPDQTPIGSANQLIDVPDLRKQDMTLTGITLESGQFQAPATNGTAAYRIASPPDPAVREFHPGETLTYAFRLLRSQKKSGDPVEARVTILRDGQEVYTAPPLTAQPGAPVKGSYTLEAAAPEGHYLLGVSAGAAQQWIDFEVKK